MNTNSIRWRLPASYAVIALLAALSLGSMMLLVLRGYYADQEREYLYGNAIALQPILQRLIKSDPHDGSLQKQIMALGFLSQSQIRLFDVNGNTIADSGAPDFNQVVAVSAGEPVPGNVVFSAPANPPAGQTSILIYGNKEGFPPPVVPFGKEISAGQTEDIILSVNASPYGYGFVARAKSDPTHRSSQVVSVPLISSDGSALGALEFSNGPSYGAAVIRSVTLAWLVASVFAIVIAAFAGWFMSRRVTRPVLALENATRRMEQGDLAVRVDLQDERQEEFVSLANSFNGMAEQVEQTVSTLRTFVSDAAHELRTPLTALQTNLELARDEKDASAQILYLSRVQEQGQQLEALVKSLLDLSRIEAAESKSNFAPVDIVQLAHEVGEQFASRAEQADRSFTMNVPDDSVSVLGNETQLRQVVVNLLENALKFTPANGWISLNLERSANEITLTVSDSGIGIPPEDVPHIFERFHRARNASDHAGNGLGLAIVKAIIVLHKGNVAVQSKPMQGTSIFVSLPIGVDELG
jgi:signal transduction histidine kinase